MHLGFRPDIQALRALAVAAVLLYHLWPGALPGGFVGVDVFFVVSGFLITSLLVRELEETGRIDLLAFYARRIRRLLPAALLVLAATYAALHVLVAPVLWPTNLAELTAASAYVLNLVLAASDSNYLAADTTPSVVQHYWSLSVEEQFYAVWPVLLVGFVAASRLLHIGRRAGTGVALAVLAVLSFALSVQMTAEQPGLAFYLPHVRAWEFALGGLVAVVRLPRLRPASARRVWLVGVAAVVLATLVFSRETAFPGWPAALPTGGTALALAAGSMGGASDGRSLVAPAVRWIGDHSYAIYLWHWPLIVIAPWVLHHQLGLSSKIVILTATLCLAWLTKRYVEDPIRVGRGRQRHLVPTFSFAVTATLAIVLAANLTLRHLDGLNRVEAALASHLVEQGRPCFGALAMDDPGCRHPFTRPDERTVVFGQHDFLPALNTCQLAPDETTAPQWCTFGKRHGHTATVALVGNSFATHLVPLFEEWAAGRKIRILLAARTACLGLVTEPVPGQPEGDPCVEWSRRAIERLRRVDDLAMVVFATHRDSPLMLTGQHAPDHELLAAARAEIRTTLRSLADAGAATVVVKHPPGPWPMSVPVCVAASSAPDDPCGLPRGPLTKDDVLATFAKRHPALTQFVSLDRFLCDRQLCHATIGGVLVYSDQSHLTTTFARTIAHELRGRLDKIVPELRPRSAQRGS